MRDTVKVNYSYATAIVTIGGMLAAREVGR